MDAAKSSAKRISIALLGRRIEASQLDTVLIERLAAVRYRDAYYLKSKQGFAFLFEYGVLVCWDLAEDERQALCYQLGGVILDEIKRPLLESYTYQYADGGQVSIHNDHLILPSQDLMLHLALSHAFAQSVKLDFFEEKAQLVIQENAYISKRLAQTGKVPLSRRDLAKLRGVLFDTSSDITLHFGLLDTPEFFWDYPEREQDYVLLAKYLDLLPRVEILNRKLSTIHELLDMLAAEQHHKHSAFLEWIIIILIAVDIIIYFF